MRKTIPAVSIIIPMYNMEKYVGECLDSILAQTFQDFEVIVVDDCSTDNSCKIVESYQPKFGDKLQLIRSEKNSGGAGIPRNKGLRLSIGKYIYFVDSDDALMENNLEVFYNAAEKFDADIVHTDKYFQAPEEIVTTDRSKLSEIVKSSDVDIKQITLLSDDVVKRVDDFVTGKMRWEPWSNFIRRDFLMEYEIITPSLSVAEDLAFFIMSYLKAKKIILIPDALYVWRIRAQSNCRAPLSPPQIIHKKAGDVFLGVKFFDEFMDKHEIFVDNAEYRYKIFEFLTRKEVLVSLYSQVPAHLLDQLVRKELDEIGISSALTAFLFARMNIFNVQLNQYGAIINQMDAYIQQQNQALQQQQEIIQKQAEKIQQLQNMLENLGISLK